MSTIPKQQRGKRTIQDGYMIRKERKEKKKGEKKGRTQ